MLHPWFTTPVQSTIEVEIHGRVLSHKMSLLPLVITPIASANKAAKKKKVHGMFLRRR